MPYIIILLISNKYKRSGRGGRTNASSECGRCSLKEGRNFFASTGNIDLPNVMRLALHFVAIARDGSGVREFS